MTDKQKELLIECVDCKHWPYSCGYWMSKHGKHICEGDGKNRTGFQLAEEATLENTIYDLKRLDIRRVFCNSQLINVAVKYLNELLTLKRSNR